MLPPIDSENSPVLLLPADILCDVFFLLRLPSLRTDHFTDSESEYDYSGWKVWVIIPQVCSRWRQVALSMPRFWSYIDLWFSRRAIEMKIERSRTAGLTVRVMDLLSDADLEKFELIMESWSRIHELHILNGPSNRRLWEKVHTSIREKSPGIIRKLCLKRNNDRNYQHSYEDSIDCSDIIRAAPSLAVLHLSEFFFEWSMCNLTNLTELSLKSLNPTSRFPNILQILNILATSPNLEILELVEAGPSNVAPAPDSIVVPLIKLSKLREFTLSRVEVNVWLKLVNRIELPCSVKWNVECEEYPMHTPVIIYPRLSTPKTTCRTLRISIDSESEAITIEASACALDTFDSYHIPYDMRLVVYSRIIQSGPKRIFNFLHSAIGNAGYECDCVWREAERLEVVVAHGNAMLEKRWIKLLSLFENLQVLAYKRQLSNYHHDATADETLADALMHRTSPGQLICPKLRTLELYSANFSTKGADLTARLCSALIFRRGHQSPLEKMTIKLAHRINPKKIASLKEVVGEVDWDEIEVSDDDGSHTDETQEEDEDETIGTTSYTTSCFLDGVFTRYT